MKFVFLGYDYMLPVAQTLIKDNHELIGIMSIPCDQIFNFNHNCKALSQHLGASYIESKVNEAHIESFIGKGAELFVSAGYPYKIPPIDEKKAYGMNIHPSYLPHARGPMPIPHIIMNEDEKASGYTIHKLADKFDMGDILFQEKIALKADENVERYCAKIAAKAPLAAQGLLKDIKTSWKKAKAQKKGKGSFYSMPTQGMRTLNWDEPLDTIMKKIRAFSRFGCYADFAGQKWHIYACDGWPEKHNYQPGECLTVQNNLAIIAVKNGFIALKEFRPETKNST